MSLLVAIIIGGVIGGLGGFLKSDNLDYFIISLLTGVVGSVIGLAIYYFGFYHRFVGTTVLSWHAAGWCLVGSGLSVGLLLFLQLARSRSDEKEDIHKQIPS